MQTFKQKRFHAGRAKDIASKYAFIVCALFSAVAVFGIVGYIVYGSVPAFQKIGFFKFLFGTVWYPEGNKYGVLPMLVNSLVVTLGATLIGGIIGVFTAIFLSYWCSDHFGFRYRGNNKFLKKLVGWVNKINLSTIFDQIIKLLAGIPSVVFGLFGLQLIIPMLSGISPNGSGQGVLACSLLLSVMIVPTIASLTKNAMDAVPKSYYEGALALGNTKAQAVFRTVVPAARSGMISALILGVGRAIGEAMAVIWVSGNRTLFPDGLFSYIRTLTTNIVMEMGYATGLHKSALIATGFVLLVLVLIITLSLNFVPKEYRGERKKKKQKTLPASASESQTAEAHVEQESTQIIYKKKGRISETLKIFSGVSAGLVAAVLLVLIFYIAIQGLTHFDPAFFSFEQQIATPTFWPALWATLEVIFFALLIALPIGVGAAIFLNEYTKPNSKFVKVIRTFIDTLAGVPSIVFGLFGNILFASLFGYSVLSGAFTVALVILPTIIRSSEESLHAVPMPLREASYGLGASKIRTILKVVLPSAFPGIATATVLAVGRIIGESAALVFTMGSPLTFSGNPTTMGSSLSVLLYYCVAEGFYMNEAYMLAFILLIVSCALNLFVYFIQRSVRKRR